MSVGRDGTLLEFAGGMGVGALKPAAGAEGSAVETLWPAAVADLAKRLTRHAISIRGSSQAQFSEFGIAYEMRASAQSPNRATCVIRPVLRSAREDASPAADAAPAAALDRRGFLTRFKDSLSIASLNEKPLSVAMIHVDGVHEITRLIDAGVSEQILGTAILRLPVAAQPTDPGQARWYVGQLSEALLAIVIESADRERIEAVVAAICSSLSEHVQLGDATFHLSPYAGVAILGQDAVAPKGLLDHARSAATEARRAGSGRVCFFSDTVKMRSLARLDIARELRDAIANRDVRLRYAPRHDLANGELVALTGYFQWIHPLRGEVRPAEFLSVAETTGLSLELSRAALRAFADDFVALSATVGASVRFSFGPLRHHVLHDGFAAEIEKFIADGPVPAERFELRIAERAYVARDPSPWKPLAERGIHLVVDEVGRKMSSLVLLARAPLSCMQLDRSWVAPLPGDEVARKVCRAGISVATALGLTPIATGVDSVAQRDALLAFGCRQGLGDLYAFDLTAALCAPDHKTGAAGSR